MKEAALGGELNKSFNRFNAFCAGMQWYEGLRYYFLKYRRYIPTQERGNDKIQIPPTPFAKGGKERLAHSGKSAHLFPPLKKGG